MNPQQRDTYRKMRAAIRQYGFVLESESRDILRYRMHRGRVNLSASLSRWYGEVHCVCWSVDNRKEWILPLEFYNMDSFEQAVETAIAQATASLLEGTPGRLQ